jgi:hypothetical protein
MDGGVFQLIVSDSERGRKKDYESTNKDWLVTINSRSDEEEIAKQAGSSLRPGSYINLMEAICNLIFP